MLRRHDPKKGKQMEQTTEEQVLEHRGFFRAVFRCERNGAPILIKRWLKKGTKLLTYILKECRELAAGENRLKKMYGLKPTVKYEFVRIERGEV